LSRQHAQQCADTHGEPCCAADFPFTRPPLQVSPPQLKVRLY
jgi:hypothetical protein